MQQYLLSRDDYPQYWRSCGGGGGAGQEGDDEADDEDSNEK